MANNVYVIDELAPLGPTVTISDDGSGVDWLTFSGVYSRPTSITLRWSYSGDQPTMAGGTYFIDEMGNGGRLLINGVIENVRGSNGADNIIGNQLANIIYGDQAATGAGGNDVINADGGNDTVYGGAGNDDISGSYGNDKLYGGTGNDIIAGGDGIDLVEGGAGADTLSGGSDIGDTVSYASSNARVIVDITRGATSIGKGGHAEGDKIYGFTNVIGSKYNDIITDTVKGTVSFDYNKSVYDGGAGNDILYLGGGNDRGIGGSGNDKIYGELGNDTLEGGSGNDKLYGGEENDKLYGGTGEDVLSGGSGNDTLYGDSGEDELKGGSGNDKLFGGSSADKLYGNSGNDRLDGGSNNDLLQGDAGKDILTGGTGADDFVFAKLSDSTVSSSGRDTITDFSRSQGDDIDLRLIDANANKSGNQAFDFIGKDAYSGTAGELRYKAADGGVIVYGDVNGDKKSDFAIFVENMTSLKSGDFLL